VLQGIVPKARGWSITSWSWRLVCDSIHRSCVTGVCLGYRSGSFGRIFTGSYSLPPSLVAIWSFTMKCRGLFIALIGRLLQEGVLVGEMETQWRARRCGRISRCGRPYDLPHLIVHGPDKHSCVGCWIGGAKSSDLIGAVVPSGAAGPTQWLCDAPTRLGNV
jgi:hypothetical protein